MMKIGIDASRAFLKNRTGIEEYSYQVIKNLRNSFLDEKVFLYVRKTDNLQLTTDNNITNINGLDLPENWKVKVIKFPRFWTQIGLSLEMFLHPVDVLFVPAHTVPIIHPARNATRVLNSSLVWFIRKFFNSREDWEYAHSVAGGPKNTVVTMHGLEYEFCPKAYSFWERIYMRISIKNSCRWATKIIAVSENTKRDLIRLYNIAAEKIDVIYEGCNNNFQFPISNFQINPNDQISKIYTKYKIQDTKYILFIGRIEERKNISNIIKAFEILKEKYQIPHRLILAGKPGFGFQKIQNKIQETRYNDQIILTGSISEEEKWELLKNAQVFVFPTQYEGFGIPILEAQSVGCPVVASNNSSIPEITICHSGLDPESSKSHQLVNNLDSRRSLYSPSSGCGNDTMQYSALLIDPKSPEEIAEAMRKLISDESVKDAIIAKGLENVKRFSWEKCAKEISEIILL